VRSLSWHAARSELLGLTAGLGLLLITVKALLLPFLVSGPLDLARWLARLAIVCAADVAFVVLMAIGCTALSAVLVRWPRVYKIWRLGLYTSFYFLGVYAILSLGFFRILMQPFTIRVWSLGGSPMTMFSSIERYLTWDMVSAVILAPLALLAVPLLIKKVAWLKDKSPLAVRPLMAALALVLVYTAVSQAYIKANWTEPRRWERRISSNPVLDMTGSCIEELLKDEPFTAYFNSDSCDMRDFVHRERPAGGAWKMTMPELKLAGPRPKNVLVFYLESISAEYLRLYGSKFDVTPHLERHAAQNGVVFENFYVSAPYSCKSVVALSASVFDRVDWLLTVSDPQQFDVPTISQVLMTHGYRTCYAHSGYWGWRDRTKFLAPRTGHLIDAENLPEQRLSTWGVKDKAMFAACLDWIDADPNTPFFLLAYTIETHHPYATPAKPLQFDVDDASFADYLNAIRATDEYIAWVLEELEKRKLLDDTLVVVTSDHGEAFGQHNQRGHNFGLYECNVHIPLIMIHPSLQEMPRRVSAVREQVDVAPTILDLLGIASPPAWQGRNLFRAENDRPAYFFCVGNFVVLGLRDGNWKYHYYVDSGMEELFNLTTDPGEDANLAEKHPQRCRDYRARVNGFATYQRQFLSRHGQK
jgi:arylsulfatase A-like enzyme